MQVLLTGNLLLIRCKNNGPIGSWNGNMYFLVCWNPTMKLNQVLANLSGCSLESPVGLEEKKKAGEERGQKGKKRVKRREALLPQKGCLSRCWGCRGGQDYQSCAKSCGHYSLPAPCNSLSLSLKGIRKDWLANLSSFSRVGDPSVMIRCRQDTIRRQVGDLQCSSHWRWTSKMQGKHSQSPYLVQSTLLHIFFVFLL